MNAFILIIALTTASGYKQGVAGIQAEFSSEARCLTAGTATVRSAEARGNYVLTWGCFPK